MDGHLDEAPELTDRALQCLSSFIHQQSGIELLPSKRAMIASRLMRRLRALNLSSFEDYCEVLSELGGDSERSIATDLLTTHKTDFFREKHHFDFLVSDIITPFRSLWKKSPRELRIWSAGCSSGEEPYTLSMVLRQHLGPNPYRILATDVAIPTLERARAARYPALAAEQIPQLYRACYRRAAAELEIQPEVREPVEFRHHNLMSPSYPSRPRHHVIFVRNTLVYFSPENRFAILAKLIRCLVPRGFLFLGHSESATGLGLPVESVGPTVYRKVAE